MTTISSYNNDLTNTSSLNIGYVEIERLLNHNDIKVSNDTNGKKSSATSASSNLIDFTSSSSSSNKDNNERLKNLIRTSNWSSTHPIRKNLWTNLLQLNNVNGGDSISLKRLNSNESEYIQYLNQIFGKCNFFFLLN